ncbi:MAG: PilZ domain-containing protein [Candidatus Omnitrophota bacterium]
MANFQIGQEIEVDQPHSLRKGSLKVRGVVSDNEIVVSQSPSERERLPLHPHTIIRVLVEEKDLVSVFQGMLVSREPGDEKWKDSDNDILYRIKNIFYKHKHYKRKFNRIKVEITAEMALKSGLFSKKSWRGVTSNLSLGGLRVVVPEEPPESGTEVSVLLDLPGGRKIQTKGEIKNVDAVSSSGSSGALYNSEYGVSIQFTKISEADLTLLSGYIDSKA